MADGIEIEIEHEAGGGRGRYVAHVAGAPDSEMTFAMIDAPTGRVMAIDHTGVPKSLAGRGVGMALLRRAVDDARRENFKIEPQCSFVRVMMDRYKELADVRAGGAARG